MLDSLRFVAAMLVARTAERKNEEGATATEYALLVGLIAVVLFIGVAAFGNALNGFFQEISGTVTAW